MAEEKTPEEEERFRRLLEGLKEEKPKEEKPRGVRVKVKKSQIALVAIGLAAVLGAYECSMASAGAFQLNDVILEGENVTIFADRVVLRGLQFDNYIVDNRFVSVQENFDVQVTNFRIKKVDAEGIVEIKASEASGTGVKFEIIGIPRLHVVRLNDEPIDITIESVEGIYTLKMGAITLVEDAPFENVMNLMETLEPESLTFENAEIQAICMFAETMTASGMELSVAQHTNF